MICSKKSCKFPWQSHQMMRRNLRGRLQLMSQRRPALALLRTPEPSRSTQDSSSEFEESYERHNPGNSRKRHKSCNGACNGRRLRRFQVLSLDNVESDAVGP